MLNLRLLSRNPSGCMETPASTKEMRCQTAGMSHLWPMRVGIEIDRAQLEKLQQLTGIQEKSLAVSYALKEYLNWQQRRAFVQKVLAGETDYSTSNDELEARDSI